MKLKILTLIALICFLNLSCSEEMVDPKVQRDMEIMINLYLFEGEKVIGNYEGGLVRTYLWRISEFGEKHPDLYYQSLKNKLNELLGYKDWKSREILYKADWKGLKNRKITIWRQTTKFTTYFKLFVAHIKDDVTEEDLEFIERCVVGYEERFCQVNYVNE